MSLCVMLKHYNPGLVFFRRNDGDKGEFLLVCRTITVANPLRVFSRHILMALPGTCCGRAVLLYF